MTDGRVLCVGVELDNPLRAAVETSAFTVLSAPTAERAHERLQTEPVTVVLSAYELPDYNGLTLAEELTAERPSLPVVLSPVDGSEQLASEAIAAGIAQYVPRSVAREDPTHLLTILDRVQQASAPRDHKRRIKALHGAMRDMVRRDSATGIAQSVVDAATELLDSPHAAAYFVDDEQSELTPVAWTEGLAEAVGTPPSLGTGSLAWSAYANSGLRIGESASIEQAPSQARRFESELAVPLGEQGVLVVTSMAQDAFDGTDSRLGTLLGANAATELALVRKERDLEGFEQAVESSGHGILITDADGIIEYANPAFEEITGYTRGEVRGETPRLLNSGEHEESFYREMWETILSGDVWHSEIINERKDGSQVVVDQTIASITGPDGSIERFVAINRDVTERAEYERRLEDQRDKLEVLNQMVRHDIRNDLQLVSSYAELLDDHIDEEGEEYVEMIAESSQSAIALTQTARDLAETMLESERETERRNVRAALHDQVSEVKSTHKDADIEFRGDIPAVDIRADDMLDSVFWNLLTNAVEHNDEDVPEVTVSATARAENVVIRIADNGPGVPDGQKEGVFGKGERGLESDGTGIGLYLVQTLVDAYGGNVWVADRQHERETAETASADGGRRTPMSRARRTADVDGSVFVVELPKSD
jgi:PAS domain S-box-containing protein